MKKYVLLLGLIIILLITWFSFGQAQCPEDTLDSGECDSLCLEIWPDDVMFTPPGPHNVRFPVYVVHDLPDPAIDSIAGFVMPFCYTHSNPAKYCSVTSYWNQIFWGPAHTPRSIFRHLPDNTTPIVRNWMMDLYEAENGGEWNAVVLDLDGILGGISHYWLTLIATGSEDQRYGEVTKRLLFTITLRLEDSMTICFDSCFWPPSSNLAFCRSDANAYTPRTYMPQCFSVNYPYYGGDTNGDDIVDVSDVVYLISYLFGRGPAPSPMERGDTNCDQTVDVSDVVFLINYLFRGGPAPSC